MFRTKDSRRRQQIVTLVVAGLLAASAPALAAPVKIVPPNQTVAQTPVIQFKAITPKTLPSTNGHPAVGTVFAIQSFSSSQSTPTSPPPGIAPCLSNGVCSQSAGCVNNATWPTVAQSITWWQSQNQNLKGTYAWTVGSKYSHQDAEGWRNNCVFKKQPSCAQFGVGWSGSYYWSYPNWVKDCRYTAQPSCSSKGAGWSGSYRWSAATMSWLNGCYYTAPPPCSTGAGWFASFTWTGTTWTGSCTYEAAPTCPTHYTCGYTWVPPADGGPKWDETSTPDRCPTGAGWTGSYYPGCTYQAQPHCPSGDTGSYSWSGSGWVSNCHAPVTYNQCWTTPSTVSQLFYGANSLRRFSGRVILGRIDSWNGASYDPNTTPWPSNFHLPGTNGEVISLGNGRIRGTITIDNNPTANGNTKVCPCNSAGLQTWNWGNGNGYENFWLVIGLIWSGQNPQMVHEFCFLPGGTSGTIPGG